MAIDCAVGGAIPGVPASKLTPADVKPVAVPVKPSKLGTRFSGRRPAAGVLPVMAVHHDARSESLVVVSQGVTAGKGLDDSCIGPGAGVAIAVIRIAVIDALTVEDLCSALEDMEGVELGGSNRARLNRADRERQQDCDQYEQGREPGGRSHRMSLLSFPMGN